MKCILCNNFESDKLQAFNNHLRVHQIYPKEYYDKFISNVGGKCIECGNNTKFVNIFVGYKKICSQRCNGLYYGRLNKKGVQKDKFVGNIIICPICKKECKSNNSLISHFQHKHIDKKIDNISKYIYDNFYKKDVDGVCLQCGKQTNYLNIKKGYNKFCNISCSRIYELDNGLFKNRKLGWRWKKYIMPSGKVINVQGYEGDCLDFLFNNGIKEKDIIVNSKEMPKINYSYKEIERTYFPDIFIKSINLILEIKSKFTYKKDYKINMIKRKNTIKNGFNYLFIIDNNFNNLKKYIGNLNG